MNQAMESANQAVFILQLNTQEAIKYVVKHTSVAADVAAKAVKNVVTWYK